ncbi:MAG: phosphatase PAP2 family protein [Ruminococcaceae bacterium]|nr:phosphatase PAP2 family protein [Oscillospiraceae bacterium]
MKSNTKQLFLFAFLFLAVFIIFTVSVMFVDVSAIGPLNSLVGLSSLNDYVYKTIGSNDFWYNVSEILGYFSFAVMFGFAIFGLYQLITRKSFKKIDKDIYLLAAFYAVMIVVYLIFEVFVVNFRPILVDGELEASYPSSHTMLVCCIMSSAFIQFNNRLNNQKTRITGKTICISVIVLTVLARLFSGVHWFTDIIGGVLISLTLVAFYVAFNNIILYKSEDKK